MIKIDIGGRTTEFALKKTKAERAYDHGSVIQVYDAGEERYLLIPLEVLPWQTARNASGLRQLEDDDDLGKTAITDLLWQRLYQGAG